MKNEKTIQVFLLILIVLLILICFKVYNNTPIHKSFSESSLAIHDSEKKLRELSFVLKNSMQSIGQLSCQLSTNQVSMNGGWCSKISSEKSKQHMTDKKLVIFFSNFFKGKYVASFGDGPGLYKKYILELNQVESYDSFDGAPYAEETTDNRVSFLDLSVPIYHLKQYDWVLSMEVAEHIPQQYEQVFLDNLVRHAKEGIILSWAVPGQNGHSHVNLKNFGYVKEQMAQRGFYVDEDNSKHIKMNTNLSWLKKNLYVYRRLK